MLHGSRSRFLRRSGGLWATLVACCVVGLSLSATLAAPLPADGEGAADHLVISELVTGGGSASDEFIEVYNPASSDLPLEALELVSVSASGATITRKATWETGTPPLGAGRHLLLANEAGAYAPIADGTYAGGLASAGGSVAIRAAGADTAIDAVGWGSSVSTWVEGTVAVAPSAGHSLERLPGGSAGSGQDTDDNVTDFVEREVPEPQNLEAPPVPEPPAEATPTPTPAATSTPTPTLAATPTPTPTPIPTISIAAARALPDGEMAIVEGVALTDSTFTDGGGFVADATAGIAVLLADGSFARGSRLRVAGVVDDRYAQRTLRADGADLVVLGDGEEPAPLAVATGTIGEALEGRLVDVAAALLGSPTVLSDGLAFDLDDGSGSVRLVIGGETGIDASGWTSGAWVSVRGVVGQRDSSGTGSAGYRVMPRDPGDLLAVDPGPTPSSSPTPDGSPSPAASGSPSATPVSIADARSAPKNSRLLVRGVVTLPTGLFDPAAAVVEDASGAIYLRLGSEARPLAVGQLIEASGTRSTWTGMESLRIAEPPAQLGVGSMPAPLARATGAIGEADEARRVTVRGFATGAPTRTSADTRYFDLDDGSGPLRVFLAPALGFDPATVTAGAELEVRGIVLQATTGQQPLRGYRLWPVQAGEITVLTPAFEGVAMTDGPLTVAPAAATPAPQRSQPAPRLAAARPAISPTVVPSATPSAPTALEPGPPVSAAGLGLLAAAVLLAAAGGLQLRGPFIERFAGLVGRARHGDVEATRTTGEGRDDAGSTLPDLVPMGMGSARAPRAGEPSTRDAEGGTGRDRYILPPT